MAMLDARGNMQHVAGAGFDEVVADLAANAGW
jgi:hypothetical protein